MALTSVGRFMWSFCKFQGKWEVGENVGKTREKGSKHVELEYSRKGAQNLWTLSPKLPVLKVVSPDSQGAGSTPSPPCSSHMDA